MVAAAADGSRVSPECLQRMQREAIDFSYVLPPYFNFVHNVYCFLPYLGWCESMWCVTYSAYYKIYYLGISMSENSNGDISDGSPDPLHFCF